MYIITVQFPNSNRNYAYKSDISGIKVGDSVVVESPYTGFTCAKVTSVEETAEAVERAEKWIVDVVDMSKYKRRVEAEYRRKVILAKLKQIKARKLEENMYEELAARDPEARILVNELKNLEI